MPSPSRIIRFLVPLLPLLVFVPEIAHAALPQDNVLDDVITRFKQQSATWEGKISAYATSLFWILNLISLAWGLSLQALSKSDIPEVFSEMFRHIMFTGFHFWLLVNGPDFSEKIISSFRTAAGSAIGGAGGLGPSDIVDIGLNIATKALANFSALSPVDSLGYILISAVILICLALIAANMMIMLCAAWFMTYAGILFLGFGGGRWTSDMAINYYKTVLSIGASLFTMTLLIGIGQAVMNDFSNAMSADAPIMEMFVCMVMAIVLMLLVDKLPQMVSGITTGALGGGFQGFGAGTGIAAASAAAGLAIGAVGGLAAAAGSISSNVAGGVNAVREAASLADAQLGIGDNPMGEAADLGGGSSGGSESDSGGSSRMSGSWLAQAGKNLAKATSAQAMSGLSEKIENSFGGKDTFGGKVSDRLQGQREDLAKSQSSDDSASQAASASEEPKGGDFSSDSGQETTGGGEKNNSIGGAPDVTDLSSELQRFVAGKE
jgi:P-type conjugative transfer protein TrbL